MSLKLAQKILIIGWGLLIGCHPIMSYADKKEIAKEKKYKEFIAAKLARMKEKSKQFEVRKESQDDCLVRRKIYQEKQKELLENFSFKPNSSTTYFSSEDKFDCQDEQKLENPKHAASYTLEKEFLNMRIKWCPELWWRFDGLEECEKK